MVLLVRERFHGSDATAAGQGASTIPAQIIQRCGSATRLIRSRLRRMGRKARRGLLAILLAVTLTVGIAGCGGGHASTKPSATQIAEEAKEASEHAEEASEEHAKQSEEASEEAAKKNEEASEEQAKRSEEAEEQSKRSEEASEEATKRSEEATEASEEAERKSQELKEEAELR